MGFEHPSEIQEQAIPELIFADKDLIGLAQTGTGKTAAFGLPLLENIDTSSKHTQALVLSPTRELGKQIAEQFQLYGKYLKKINILPVYGGASISDQMRALKKGQHIIIATPGRLIDLIKRKAIKLEKIKILILDEADEMLNMGFKEDLDEILSYTPDEKLTWLFSATMPSEIKRITKKYMTDPVEIRVNTKNEVNKDIEHKFAVVKRSDKTEALTRFMDVNPEMRGVVFCRTRRDTQDLSESLIGLNYKADALHGDLSQAQRDRVMKKFKNGKIKVLVATDVAARGIDVNDLTHVFHFTLPDTTDYYTHRSGRTARAGKKGISIAFISGRDKGRIHRLSTSLDIKFEKILIPQNNEIAELRLQKWTMSILEAKSKEVDEVLFENTNLLLANLSKEELIKKLLALEVAKFKNGSGADLNDKEVKGGRGERSRGGRGGRGRDGGQRRNRDRDRDRKRRRDGRGGSGSSRKKTKDSEGKPKKTRKSVAKSAKKKRSKKKD